MGFEDQNSSCEIVIEVPYRQDQKAAGGRADDDPLTGPPAGPPAGTIAVDPDSSPESAVHGGTISPTLVPLDSMQVPAIGSLEFCSGTLIAPTWVLTAKHCGLTVENSFCIGERNDDANICFTPTRVIDHPAADLTLIELSQPPAERMPGLHPIPIMTETLDCSWLGTMAEAAGYGRAPNLGFGTRFFTAEPIVALSHNSITIDGLGRRGMCGGDSGGPVMVEASDGSVRVAGVLEGGDATCRGLDYFSRTDTAYEWIESFVGHVEPELGDRR